MGNRIRHQRGKPKSQTGLIVLFGTDHDSIMAYYNQTRDALPDTKLYELDNLEQLIWALDEAHSDDVVGHIDTVIFVMSTFSEAAHKLITIYKHERRVDYHFFEFAASKWAGYTPDSAHRHRRV